MSQDPKAVVRAYLEAMDAMDWDRLRTLMHPEHRFHFPLAPAPLDREGHIGLSQGFRQGFGEFNHIVTEQLASGDKVATRGKVRMKHTGEFNGVPASGNEVEIGFLQMAEVVDGTLRHEHVQLDALGLLQGIGALPAPPA